MVPALRGGNSMSVYLIARVKIHDRSGYANYIAGFMAVLSGFKARLLSVDESPELLEGSWDVTRTVLIEFPDKSEAKAWYNSREYQELAKHRLGAAEADIVLVQGRDTVSA
jgi:uncharacterized protein (DUF1330 family)